MRPFIALCLVLSILSSAIASPVSSEDSKEVTKQDSTESTTDHEGAKAENSVAKVDEEQENSGEDSDRAKKAAYGAFQSFAPAASNKYGPVRGQASYTASGPSYSGLAGGYSSHGGGYGGPAAAPAQSYSAPAPAYSAPAASYPAPAPGYSAAAPAYSGPAPTYSASGSAYSAPAAPVAVHQSYGKPVTYSAPSAPTFHLQVPTQYSAGPVKAYKEAENENQENVEASDSKTKEGARTIDLDDMDNIDINLGASRTLLLKKKKLFGNNQQQGYGYSSGSSYGHGGHSSSYGHGGSHLSYGRSAGGASYGAPAVATKAQPQVTYTTYAAQPPCPTNYLFGCQPHVRPVPCSQSFVPPQVQLTPYQPQPQVVYQQPQPQVVYQAPAKKTVASGYAFRAADGENDTEE
ncbi:RNA-binding protein 14-like [Ctenocephalides felis]|uniref:RNA-binding protein 14-like n=1 Tax=Ctenocephalides felis TaxID=7515 RepID=UPI000E6E1A3C|nr:RNA-binding protein 14-like [Ctenocephalides felis]